MAAKLTHRTDSILSRRELGTCAYAGMTAGIVTGFLLTVLDLIDGPLAEGTARQLLLEWLISAAFGWLVIITLLTVFVDFRLSTVAVPAFVNSVLVTAGMVTLCWLFSLFVVAWLVGLLTGLVVGQVLCSLYQVVTHSEHGRNGA